MLVACVVFPSMKQVQKCNSSIAKYYIISTIQLCDTFNFIKLRNTLLYDNVWCDGSCAWCPSFCDLGLQAICGFWLPIWSARTLFSLFLFTVVFPVHSFTNEGDLHWRKKLYQKIDNILKITSMLFMWVLVNLPNIVITYKIIGGMLFCLCLCNGIQWYPAHQ